MVDLRRRHERDYVSGLWNPPCSSKSISDGAFRQRLLGNTLLKGNEMKRMKKYRMSTWTSAGSKEYGIDERYLFFFWRPLCFTKVVSCGDGTFDHSYEILTFKNRFEASLEIERLKDGDTPIQRLYYSKGKLVATSRYNG